LAAVLVGSYAEGMADHHSDLDLILFTGDEAYEAFLAGRDTFVRQLGEPLFLESFDLPNIVFAIFSDGSEVEFQINRESQFGEILSGPHQLLLDKKGLLAEAVLQGSEADQSEAIETLHRQLNWFWHDLSHFITALDRNQLWWAHGQLELLRHYCVNVARLRHNFLDAEVGGEPYFKVDQALPVEQLAPLEESLCPLEKEAMLHAGRFTVRYFQDVARPLAERHGLVYPAELEQIMVGRLSKLTGDG
jgi:hypothetical protein